jgi:hypothetical protein
MCAGSVAEYRTDPRGATSGMWEGHRALSTGRSYERMTSQGRSHALLAKLKAEQGEPFLPKVGELYLINTDIYWIGTDPAAARPAVVVCVPPPSVKHSPIRVVTRTSQKVQGVPHPADRTLRCDRDGVFSRPVSVEQHMWTRRNVELLGELGDPYLTQVMERF